MASNSNKANKILVGVVVALVVLAVGLVTYQNFIGAPYGAVYLKTGDLYFGKITEFPSFGLRNVYFIQSTGNAQTPLSIQKLTNVFWGPQDYLKINRSEVVWIAKLSKNSQLLQFLKNPAQLNAPSAQNQPAPSALPSPSLSPLPPSQPNPSIPNQPAGGNSQ